MNIVVCVKQVPESAAVGMDGRTNTLIRDGIPLVLNPADEHALEAALALKTRTGANVSVVTMGKESASAVLVRAATLGADALFLVSDPAFAGSDTFATATVLAKALGSMTGPDLVLCGRRASDGETGQVGPELAVFLGIPCVTNVVKLGDFGKGSVVCHRLTEEGEDVIEVLLPALITVCEGMNHPRLPSIEGLRRARAVRIVSLSNADLRLPAGEAGLEGSYTRVVRVYEPAAGGRACVPERDIAAGAAAAAEKIIGLLEAGNA